MKKKSILFLVGLCATMMCACNKGEQVSSVEQGSELVLDSLEITNENLDKEGRTYLKAESVSIDSSWKDYFYLNGHKVTMDNLSEVITDVSHSILNEDTYNLLDSDGGYTGSVTMDASRLAFSELGTKGTQDESMIVCGDTYDKVLNVLGTPNYDSAKDLSFVMYDSENKQLTVQFMEYDNALKVSGIFINPKE